MFLLDTHILIWWLEEPSRLSGAAQDAIGNKDSLVYVSAVSVWEIETKRAIGKLKAPDNLEERIAANRFLPLAVTFAHAAAAPKLPPHHHDPFDRLLVAQARHEGLKLISRDPHVPLYDVAHIVG